MTKDNPEGEVLNAEALEKPYDDSDPVMAHLSQIERDGYATDKQRGTARMAMAEILRLRALPPSVEYARGVEAAAQWHDAEAERYRALLISFHDAGETRASDKCIAMLHEHKRSAKSLRALPAPVGMGEPEDTAEGYATKGRGPTARNLAESIAELAINDRHALIQRIAEIIIKDRAHIRQRWEKHVEAARSPAPDTISVPRPQPTHYAVEEGGIWLEWGINRHVLPVAHKHIHSIKFSDGSIFDAVNGWRKS